MLERIDGPSDLKRLSIDQLEVLAREIRDTLVARVTENGGHLASNLGVVELTLALHSVFDSPHDKLVWDVGHQAYVHKLVTGRRQLFSSIRTYEGLAGFCSREESEHDAFGAGHAGTSVSAGLGLAIARDLRATDEHVVSIIGDGAMSCGLAFEGLNNAGHLGSRLIVVLNDNEMSIAPNVGALASYLARVRTNRRYHRAKAGVEWTLKHLPRGSFVLAGLKRLRQAARIFIVPNAIWEELGFTYVGPLDGHNVGQLIDVFQRVKLLEKPVLVHVITKKGKGYAPAEKDAVGLHGISPKGSANPKTPGEKSPNGTAKLARPKPPTYTQVFGDTLVALAARDPRIVAITAAMPDGTGLTGFARAFPSRFFDVGIAEAHAVTFAAGLAASGMRPVVAVYSTFLQRAYDSIVHDVCIQRLPVVFAIDRAGLVGEDGRTHHGAFDLSYLRSIPNLMVMAPSDEAELQRMLRTALTYDGPVAIRYPRGAGVGAALAPSVQDIAPIEIGRSVVLRKGQDVTLIAVGSMVGPALAAADLLEARGVSAGVVDSRFVKPLDEAALREAARQTPRLVTVEENVLAGGFGSAVAECLSALESVSTLGAIEGVQMLKLGLPDRFVEHGPPELLRELSGLSPSGICRSVLAAYPDLQRVAATSALVLD
jgi:1-deoxy-D-xylulose-5-phosphate synthase